MEGGIYWLQNLLPVSPLARYFSEFSLLLLMTSEREREERLDDCWLIFHSFFRPTASGRPSSARFLFSFLFLLTGRWMADHEPISLSTGSFVFV